MGHKAIHFAVILICTAMISACGSNSSTPTDTAPDLTDPDNIGSPRDDEPDAGDPNTDDDNDGADNAGQNDTGSGSSTPDANNNSDGFESPSDNDGSDSTINVPPDTGDNDSGEGSNTDDNSGSASSYCAQISTDISYELFYGQCDCGRDYARYVPAGYPGIYGWDGESYCDLTGSSNVEEISLLVPYSANAPAIDGISTPFPEDWRTAAGASWSAEKRHMLLTQNLLTDNGNGYRDGARASDFLITHDMEYLYIHVLPRNEGSATGFPQTYLDSDEPSEDDSIEIFIDGDNSKGTTYDGIDDFHTIIAYLDSSRTPETGPNSAPGLQLEFDTDEDNRTDVGAWVVYEVKINLASAGITVGKPFGLEIQLNEDDNGGPADASFGWSQAFAGKIANSNPSVFGTVVLTSCTDLSDCDMNQSLIGE